MLTTIRRSIIGMLTLLLTYSASVAEYELTNTAQGYPFSIAADSSGSTIVVGLRRAGFWRTEDGGATWVQLNDRISDSLILSPKKGLLEACDPAADTLVISTNSLQPAQLENVYYSLDGGQTWAEPNIDPFWPDSLWNTYQFRDYTIFVREDPGKVFRRHGDGFAISTDGGSTWSVVDIHDIQSGVENMHFEQSRPDTIYFTGFWDTTEGGIIASYDGGWTWQQLTTMGDIATGEGFVMDMVRMDDSTLIAASISSNPDIPTFLRSDDDGQTWYWTETEGLPSIHLFAESLCSVPEFPGRILLGLTTAHGIWESNDYGETWHRALNGLPINGTDPTHIYRNEYSGHIYAGFADAGLFRSTDGAESWHPIPGPPVGYVSGEWHSLVIGEGGVLSRSHESNLFAASGSSTFFEEVITPVEPTQWITKYPISYDPGELRFNQLRQPFWPESGVGSPLTYSSVLTITETDTIATPELGDEYAFRRIDRISTDSTDILVASNSGTRLRVSQDLGGTWTTTEPGFYYQQLQAIDDQLLALVLSPPDLKVSDDLGHTWSSLDFPDFSTGGLMAGEYIAIRDTLLVRSENRVWAMHPDGTWEQRGSLAFEMDMGYLHWDVIQAHDQTMIVAGKPEWHQLRISHDNGWTWEAQPLEVDAGYDNEFPLQIEYDPWRDRLWIATSLGLAYLNDPTTAVGEEVWTFQPADYITLDTYPNPFNANTTVRYQLTRPQEVTLDVFDLLGRRVATLDQGQRAPGHHVATFDGTSLSSGSYFVRLKAGDHTKRRRIVLTK